MFPPIRRASAGLAVFTVPPNGAVWLLPKHWADGPGEAGGRLRRAIMGIAGIEGVRTMGVHPIGTRTELSMFMPAPLAQAGATSPRRMTPM